MLNGDSVTSWLVLLKCLFAFYMWVIRLGVAYKFPTENVARPTDHRGNYIAAPVGVVR